MRPSPSSSPSRTTTGERWRTRGPTAPLSWRSRLRTPSPTGPWMFSTTPSTRVTTTTPGRAWPRPQGPAVHCRAVPSSPHDVTLELERLQDLFSPPSFDEFGEAADIPSGIERLVTQIKATRGSDIRVTVVVPAGAAGPELEPRLGAAIRSYAAQRRRDVS